MATAYPSVCVCGAGTMGSGIAQLAAQAGLKTILYEVNEVVLAQAKAGINQRLTILETKQVITSTQKQDTLSCLRFTNHITECRADIFIEAIIENIAAKAMLFTELNKINSLHAVFATNTSSLSVTAVAATVPNPERVVGMHFFNPPGIMKLVEVVRAAATSDAAIEAVTSLARLMGKVTVVCKDAPGFIVNRIARPYYLEALRLMEQGVAPEHIDRMMEAVGFKMGPFRLMDFIGHDINFTASSSVYEALGRPPRLAPSVIQQQLVEAGNLGRKTGKGFYEY